MKSDCPTYLKSKDKAMAVTFSDGEVSDDESECDENGNFIAFTTTAVVNESISAEENPSETRIFDSGQVPHQHKFFFLKCRSKKIPKS